MKNSFWFLSDFKLETKMCSFPPQAFLWTCCWLKSPGVSCRPSLQSLLAGLGWHAAYCHLLQYLGCKSWVMKRKIERKKQSLSRVVDKGPGVSRLPLFFSCPSQLSPQPTQSLFNVNFKSNFFGLPCILAGICKSSICQGSLALFRCLVNLFRGQYEHVLIVLGE